MYNACNHEKQTVNIFYSVVPRRKTILHFKKKCYFATKGLRSNLIPIFLFN